MSVFFILLISSLAVFRLSELVSIDKGPFEIFKKVRRIFPQGSQLDQMIECVFCQSGYWSLIFAICIVLSDRSGSYPWFLWWLGIWGGAAYLLKSSGGRSN